jgi:AcrR family transcriptional regulator
VTALFLDRGFEEVSVSEVAEAADVARPTVFAHFPRKEDLVFDRYPEAEALFTAAVRDRGPDRSAVQALSDLLVTLAEQGHPAAAMRAEFAAFWRMVAASRPLLARARELAESVERQVGRAMAETGVAEPELTAALTVAAYRTVHLASIRRILDGADPERVASDHGTRIRLALGRVDAATATSAARG